MRFDLEEMNLTATNETNINVAIDNYTLIEQQLRKQYGLWIHPHWYQYLHIINSTNDLLFTGIGAYITIVCVIGSIASLAVIVITAR